MMSQLSDNQTDQAKALARLTFCNPFIGERVQLEKKVLKQTFTNIGEIWSFSADYENDSPNIEPLDKTAEALAERLRDNILAGSETDADDLLLYESIVLYTLYSRYRSGFSDLIALSYKQPDKDHAVDFFNDYLHDCHHYFDGTGLKNNEAECIHIFSVFFQIRRAFHHIFKYIVGQNQSAGELRRRVWESIFTNDMLRYRASAFQSMHDYTTTIIGPSGTGKELVAKAIAKSGYIPFSVKERQFKVNFNRCFVPLNISSMPDTLIESELFGHIKGSFTGAHQDKTGWLETCVPEGTVFLDEIGDLNASIQVKLLRVLQERQFQRIGDNRLRPFSGKVIVATHKNLAEEIDSDRFRLDFYYRICSDVICTPGLHQQIQGNSGELRTFVSYLCKRICNDTDDHDLTSTVLQWIDENLGQDYPWPGNIRELEQCIRNIIIHGSYSPIQLSGRKGSLHDLVHGIEKHGLTSDDLLKLYCSASYARTENYQETARLLNLDRRTVKSKVDDELVAKFKGIGD